MTPAPTHEAPPRRVRSTAERTVRATRAVAVVVASTLGLIGLGATAPVHASPAQEPASTTVAPASDDAATPPSSTSTTSTSTTSTTFDPTTETAPVIELSPDVSASGTADEGTSSTDGGQIVIFAAAIALPLVGIAFLVWFARRKAAEATSRAQARAAARDDATDDDTP